MHLTAAQIGTAKVITNVLRIIGNIPAVDERDRTPPGGPRSSITDGVQPPLPSNQWQVEVDSWHSAIMSLIQHGLLEYVMGPDDEELRKYVLAPPTPEERAACERQRVRTSQGGFANVSGLGLFFTIGLGAIRHPARRALGPRWIATDATPFVEGNDFLDPIVDSDEGGGEEEDDEAKTDETRSRLSGDSFMDIGRAS
ncbi:hypothetical protein F5Y14DRAFT_450132 [Nemania sp. NC0429]|nr:hypothetical protein F5Y14DRAFT_450132 [Nemania sp. NC0429]